MFEIDKMAYSSNIRDKNPFFKIIFSIGSLLFAVFTYNLYMSTFILITMGYLTVKYSQVSFCKYLKMISWTFGFLMLSGIALLIDISSNPLSVISISIGQKFIGISIQGIYNTANVLAVSLSSVSCLYFLSLTTPMMDIIFAMKKLKIPNLLVEITLLMYRFIFVLVDIVMQIKLAQESRLGDITFKKKIKSFGVMMSVLLVRALNKSNKMYDGMEARNYDGNINVLWEHNKVTNREKAILLLLFIILSTICYYCKFIIGK